MTGYIGRFAREFKKNLVENHHAAVGTLESAFIYNEIPPFDVLPDDNSPNHSWLGRKIVGAGATVLYWGFYGLGMTLQTVADIPKVTRNAREP